MLLKSEMFLTHSVRSVTSYLQHGGALHTDFLRVPYEGCLKSERLIYFFIVFAYGKCQMLSPHSNGTSGTCIKAPYKMLLII